MQRGCTGWEGLDTWPGESLQRVGVWHREAGRAFALLALAFGPERSACLIELRAVLLES